MIDVPIPTVPLGKQLFTTLYSSDWDPASQTKDT